MPPWLKIADISINRTSFELSNGSQVKASSTSGDAGRSEALSLLVVDEAAFVEGMDEFRLVFAPLCQRVVGVSHCLHLMGLATGFIKLTTRLLRVKTISLLLSYLGQCIQIETKNGFKKRQNMSLIAQELECNFNASGDTVVSGDDIKRLRHCLSHNTELVLIETIGSGNLLRKGQNIFYVLTLHEVTVVTLVLHNYWADTLEQVISR